MAKFLSKDKIKHYYESGIWTEQMVQNAYAKSAITYKEMEEILGSQEQNAEEAPVSE